MNEPLHALSPLDERYAESTAPLSGCFSEFAFLRDRVRVELDFLSALSKTNLTRPLTDSESTQIESIKSNFSSPDAEFVLRVVGKPDAYESLKQQTRGRVLTEAGYKSWCDAIDVDDEMRARLKSLSTETYIGLAIELTDRVVDS